MATSFSARFKPGQPEGGVHVTVQVYAGQEDWCRGLAGEIVLRRHEAVDFCQMVVAYEISRVLEAEKQADFSPEYVAHNAETQTRPEDL